MMLTLAIIGVIVGGALTAICLPVVNAYLNNKFSK